MDGTPYEKWASNLERLFKRFKLSPKLILDLGCGTGGVTIPMSRRGYEMIGVDISVDMLNIAREKAAASELDILYLNQDMRSFELYGTVDACISVCDSMNYILNPAGLKKVFKLVKNYLNPGGYFIFDLNTLYFFRQLASRGSFGEIRENCAFICETGYSEKRRVMEYCVDVFVQNGDIYNRFSEVHFERAYAMDEIVPLIEQSGLNFRGVYDAKTLKAISAESERVYVCCCKST
jgi:SAM-dependent methyltransferase